MPRTHRILGVDPPARVRDVVDRAKGAVPVHAAADPGELATDPVRAAHAVRDPLRLAAVAALGDLTADPWCEELTRSAGAHIGVPVALVSIMPPAAGMVKPTSLSAWNTSAVV